MILNDLNFNDVTHRMRDLIEHIWERFGNKKK